MGGAVFWGEFTEQLDARGRLRVPAALRAALADGLVVTRGLDGCLLIYPAGRWENVAAMVGALPFTRGAARSFTRLFLGGASEQRLDAQGRLAIPDTLRRYAGLDASAVFVGAGDHLEVWAQPAWSSVTAQLASESAAIAESLSQLGFALT